MKTIDGIFYRYFPVSQRDEKWGLHVTTAGDSRVAPHSAYPAGKHPKDFAFDWRQGRVLGSFALLYISSGRGRFECGSDFSSTIEPGHAFLIFPGVWHRYAPDAAVGWHEHWLGFDGELPRRWRRHKFISPKAPLVKFNTEDAVLTAFSNAMQSIRANRPALQQILAGTTANLLGLFYSAQQALPDIEVEHANKIESAIAQIQKGFAKHLDMKQLAEELGVSYSWFRARFSDYTGLAPHQYLLELRVIRARNLLAETHLTIKQIAMQTGFGDEHYFSRLFRQKLNHTPSQWRERNRRTP